MMDCLLMSPAVARARLVARRMMELLMMVTVSSWTSDSLRNVQMSQSLSVMCVCLWDCAVTGSLVPVSV